MTGEIPLDTFLDSQFFDWDMFAQQNTQDATFDIANDIFSSSNFDFLGLNDVDTTTVQGTGPPGTLSDDQFDLSRSRNHPSLDTNPQQISADVIIPSDVLTSVGSSRNRELPTATLPLPILEEVTGSRGDRQTVFNMINHLLQMAQSMQ